MTSWPYSRSCVTSSIRSGRAGGLAGELVVLQRRRPRPCLSDADRRFWILASRWFSDWRNPLLIVKPETVLGWHRAGWRAYWRWRSSRQPRGGRPAIREELQALIGRMAAENRLWGQKRIQAELARLGFKVSARTVAKYMRVCRNRGPTGTWREFLTRHASDIWACDFFCVPTVLFQTLHVFFVIRLANREILHVEVTRHPTAGWAAQQMVECCAWDRAPPRFLIHDRDSRYGASFDRRVRGLGIQQVRTPFRSPRANAVAERWVRSARSECLDHLIVFSEANLRRVLLAYVTYYNRWRPHRSLGQQLHVGRRALSPSNHVERSPRNLYSAGYTTFTGLLRDRLLRPTTLHNRPHFCALRPLSALLGHGPAPCDLAQASRDSTMPDKVGSGWVCID
jgi:transposase InsO family protein